MRIWVLKSGENIPFKNSNTRSMRIGILSEILSQNGHEVIWWTSAVNHLSKSFYPEASHKECLLEKGTKVVFLPTNLYQKNISLKRFVSHIKAAQSFNKLASKYHKPDVVFCCFPTPELCYSAIQFCKKNNIPIIIDIRDLYPDVYIEWLPRIIKPLGKIIFYPMVWLTKRIMREATALTAISSEYLQWGLKYSSRNKNIFDGVFPLAYPKNKSIIKVDQNFMNKFPNLDEKKIILYIGSFISSIDLETVVYAAKKLREQGNSQFYFILVGDGERRGVLEDLSKGLDNILFTGWLNFHEIQWIAKQAWAGVCAYKKGALMSLPNKTFEYMSFGLPIISCLKRETKEMLERHKCGIYYEAGNPDGFIDCLQHFDSFPSKREEMRKASIDAYKENYCSEIVYKRLSSHILELAHYFSKKGT